MKLDTKAIRAQVDEELADPLYLHLRHGHRHTYNLGCRGPLCRRSGRLNMREFLNKKRLPEDQIPETELDRYLSILQNLYEYEYSSRPVGVAS